MKLKIYLLTKGLTQSAFAKTLGIHRAYFQYIYKGRCSKKIAEKIKLATDGEIDVLDVCPSYYSDPVDKRTRKHKSAKYNARVRN